ncbi:hypothetical protein GCM10027562_11540 [Arthrobacter pigmenti]
MTGRGAVAGLPKVVCLGPADYFILGSRDDNKPILIPDGFLKDGAINDRPAADLLDCSDRFDIV